MQSLPPASSLAKEKDLYLHLRSVCTLRENSRDFPGSPVVKTLPSNVGAVGPISGQGAKIPQSCGQKSKTQHRNDIVTNSVKTLKMVHIKKKKKEVLKKKK